MTKQFQCAMEIAAWLGEHSLNDDVMIYVDGSRYTVDETGKMILERQCNVHDYIEYAGNILSASFEGPLYDVLNYSFESKYYTKLEEDFSRLLKKFGYYYELCQAWSLTLADI